MLDNFSPSYEPASPNGRVRRRAKARGVAISIEDRRTQRWHQMLAGLSDTHALYLINKRLRHYSLEELGRFQLISDVLSPTVMLVRLSKIGLG